MATANKYSRTLLNDMIGYFIVDSYQVYCLIFINFWGFVVKISDTCMFGHFIGRVIFFLKTANIHFFSKNWLKPSLKLGYMYV